MGYLLNGAWHDGWYETAKTGGEFVPPESAFRAPVVAGTVSFDHIKRHYYMSHEHLNPSRIVPVGPCLDFDRPHGRDRL